MTVKGDEVFLNASTLKIKGAFTLFECTGGPRYMRSFYLRFRVYAIEKLAFFLEPIL